jgi:hypothetical protein
MIKLPAPLTVTLPVKKHGRHYQAGGLIVSVSTDPASGDPSIVPTSLPALTRELSVAATSEKYDGQAKDWVGCDPPARHAGILRTFATCHHWLAWRGNRISGISVANSKENAR